MDQTKPEELTPETAGEKTLENQPEKVTPQIPEEIQKELATYKAQKEHFREKTEKLEGEVELLRKQLETNTANLNNDDYAWSDEGRAILKKTEALEKELLTLKTERELNSKASEALSKYPKLKEHEGEFRDFISKNPYVDTNILAESFLYGKKESRKGLEGQTGGDRMPTSTDISFEESSRIAQSDEKLYAKLIREGKLKIK